MTSKSRIAQQALTELEKTSAAFDQQLVEAAKFIGIDDIGQISPRAEDNVETTRKKRRGASSSHGKEEWLLKWLLKRLQNAKDDVPRRTSGSWLLLRVLLQRLSVSTSAKILVERKFVTVLQTTLEEVKQLPVDNEPPKSNGEIVNAKSSKKRKRSENVQEDGNPSQNAIKSLLVAVLAVLEFMVQSTRAGSASDEARGSEYAAEYMRAVLRVTAEDAAKILGLWLSLVKKHDLLSTSIEHSWINAFVEIWQLHISDENYLTHFSLHCTLPLLALRSSSPHMGRIQPELEQLIARNIVSPSKAARIANEESTLLADLTRVAVISDSKNASFLFDVIIRSIQPHGIKRRLPADETWLKVAFGSLVEAMPRVRIEQNAVAVHTMLSSAIEHKVDLDLDVLRSITQEFALEASTKHIEWKLLSLMIKLDANVFLIRKENDEQDLLQQLFTKINLISTANPESAGSITQVVSDVLIPLMGSFAKARDLAGFIHHWHAELKIAKNVSSTNSSNQSAWETLQMQDALKPLLEKSLSVQQVLQLLNWLEEQFAEYPEETVVLLQAVSGGISQEEYVDAVGARCYSLAFNVSRTAELDAKHRQRTISVLANTFAFVTDPVKEELAELWNSGAPPFGTLLIQADEIRKDSSADSVGFFELWRLGCVVWNASKDASALQKVARPFVLKLLQSLGQRAKLLMSKGNEALSDDIFGDVVVKCIEYMLTASPKTLLLASELEESMFREFVENIFELVCLMYQVNNDSTVLSSTWLQVLQQDVILNNSQVTDVMIDIMLDAVSSKAVSKRMTELAIQALLQLPMAVIHRRHRERILASWHVTDSGLLNPSVLALKIKIMRFPMFYESMTFQHLVDLASCLQNSPRNDQLAHVTLAKQLMRLNLDFILSDVDQSRNQKYIKDAFAFASKESKRIAEKQKHSLDIGTTALLGIVLDVLNSHSKTLFEANVVKEKDLLKAFSRAETGLLSKMQIYLHAVTEDTAQNNEILHIAVLLDALNVLELKAETLEVLSHDIDTVRKAKPVIDQIVRERLDAFAATRKESNNSEVAQVTGFDCASTSGRKSIAEKASLLVDGASDSDKMRLLKSLTSNSSSELARLLALRHILLSSEDTRKSRRGKYSDSDSSDDDASENVFDLSEAYSSLCASLPRATSVRQFSIISETLTTMLRIKARSITQWNIDSTLGAIATICSRNGPALRSSRASTVYSHLCHLFQAILSSHRLKLEGHFHLVVQALQALLRCLFIPLPHSSTKVLKANAPPPWLSVTPSTYTLNAMHAAAFTRLVTMICDPSVSSVTHRSKNNALTSATDKAKRMAGQHMVFMLMSYVKLQLDMKMMSGMREKMTPGLYAIFDTTTMESRRAVSEALDSSGRAVFGVLYRDYLKFGKWKGS